MYTGAIILKYMPMKMTLAMEIVTISSLDKGVQE